MKIQLIKHKTGYIGISNKIEDENILGKSVFIDNDFAKFIIDNKSYKIICTTPDLELEGVPLIDLKNYDLHKASRLYYGIDLTNCSKDEKHILNHFKGGFDKAKEKYKYTEEDLESAIKLAQEESYDEGGYLGLEYEPNEILKQINQLKEIKNIQVEENKTQTINGKQYLIINKINYKSI